VTKNRRPQPHPRPEPVPSAELERILCDLASSDENTRAAAVRELCPCRGTCWEVPVFEQVLALRSDPSPVVRHAVKHDLQENPDWGERQEARRLEGRQARQEVRWARREIDAGLAEGEPPATHSLAWRMPRRPRSRKGYYPRGRR
jgi:hypothetical protein